MSRLNLPKYFYTEILSKIGQLSVKDKKKENVLAYVIYKTLNDMGCGVTIKEINSVTGFSDVEIYNKQPPNESVIFDPLTSAEKYCILMGLPHQTPSLQIQKHTLEALLTSFTNVGGSFSEVLKNCAPNLSFKFF